MHFKRYLIRGLITIIPLGMTWWLLSFLYSQLVKVGQPLAQWIAGNIHEDAPGLAGLLLTPWFNNLLAALFVVCALYLLGLATSRVIGRQFFSLIERIVDRLPLARSIYGSIKKLIGVLQTRPENLERVVLINFPHQEMKAVGLVTRTLTDQDTGRQLAAVYVPTTPNPTNGFLELVPVENLIATDWSMEEAMTFIISGGAISPENIRYDKPEPPA